MMTSAILCPRLSQRVGGRHDNAISTNKLHRRNFPVYSVPPCIPMSMNWVKGGRTDESEGRPPPQARPLSSHTLTQSPYQDYQFPLKMKDQLTYRPRAPSLASTSSDESSSTITSYKSSISHDDLDESNHLSASFKKMSSPNSSRCAPSCPLSRPLYCQPVISTSSDNDDDGLGVWNNETHLKQQKEQGLKKKPQNFRDDPKKRARVKTELCQNFMMGKHCKFGKKCNYAHGRHELKLTKLKERHEAGLLDATTYRTRPCFNHIATGACPFDDRCANVHDPRAAGKTKWWLPHCELQVHQLDTDLHIDYYGHQQFSNIHNGNAFGQSKDITSSWKSFYQKVCGHFENQAVHSRPPLSGKSQPPLLTEIQRLEIALVMRKKFSQKNRFKYHPTHIIFDEMCMLVQTRSFSLSEENSVKEICLEEFNPSLPHHILVREISFGSLSCPNERPLALWFNIPDECVNKCTLQQIRRNKRTKRQLSSKQGQQHTLDSQSDFSNSQLCYADVLKNSNKRGYCRSCPKSFDDVTYGIEKPLYVTKPTCEDAYMLVTDILIHRLDILRRQIPKTQATVNGVLMSEEGRISQRFHSLHRHYSLFHWPIHDGRDSIDDETPVPPSVTNYLAPSKCPQFRHTWNAFILNLKSGNITQDSNLQPQSGGSNRLKVFRALSKGSPLSSERKPFLFICKKTSPTKNMKDESELSSQHIEYSDSDKCWKSLLLSGFTQWDELKDFYYSRCNVEE